MKKIIITGASGFVGKNLCAFLQGEGFFVRKMSLKKNSWRDESFNSFHSIIHLAGKAHDTSNTSLEADYYKINSDLTKEIFNKFLQSSIENFFYFSSVKAVADTLEGVLDETYTPTPKTPYGKSKFQAEEYLLSKSLPENKRLFIIRPCMIHGPGNKGNLNLLFNIVRLGLPWPLGAYDNSRSFLSIDNLNYLIRLMIDNKKVRSGIYNFADDESLSTNKLVRIISIELNKKTRIVSINKGLIESLARFGDRLSFPLNSERLKKLTESYIVSNAKIKNELGIDNLPISVVDGLKATVKSFIKF